MLIGFIGAPSSGKSTTALGLSFLLKKQGYAVEFLPEYARRHIMDCRLKGVTGNGGYDGQTVIYNADRANSLYYRKYSDAVTIMDGSTLNCYFYNGFMHISLTEEAKLYDLLFYIPVLDAVPVAAFDPNRVQDTDEILSLGRKWEERIRPLLSVTDNIVELAGYPVKSQDEMAAEAYTHVLAFQEAGQAKKQAA